MLRLAVLLIDGGSILGVLVVVQMRNVYNNKDSLRPDYRIGELGDCLILGCIMYNPIKVATCILSVRVAHREDSIYVVRDL